MAPLTVEAIDRFIGQGNPLAQAGGARTLLRATEGNLAGAAFLAALARKESEFGRTAGRFRNNFWGWGVHLGPDVNTSPSVEAGAAKVWRGLSSSLYRGAGLVTPGAIIQRYAPPSENNTDLYKTQVGQWFTQLGLSPQTNIFSGATVPVPPGGAGGGGGGSSFSPAAAPGLSRVPGNPAVASPSGLRLTPALQGRLQAYLQGSYDDVLAGRTPRDALPLVRAIAAASSRAVPRAAPSPVMDFQGRTSAGGGHHAGDGHDHGYESGGVDSGKAFAGGDGGNWGGSMPLALSLAKAVGLPVSSQKRSRQRTASGGVSDHWVGSTSSYAVDLATSGAAGDRAYVRTMNALGLDSRRYPSGRWHNVNIGGYRYQIGWRTPGHYDHIHVGVKKL